jgi:hypothetical protein
MLLLPFFFARLPSLYIVIMIVIMIVCHLLSAICYLLCCNPNPIITSFASHLLTYYYAFLIVELVYPFFYGLLSPSFTSASDSIAVACCCPGNTSCSRLADSSLRSRPADIIQSPIPPRAPLKTYPDLACRYTRGRENLCSVIDQISSVQYMNARPT